MPNDPSVFGDDPRQQRNQALYGGDPNTAMYNIMLDSGRNPLRANPFTQQLMQAGAGLQLAARMKHLNMTPDQINAAGGSGELMRSELAGAVKGGNVFSTLNSAAQGVPGVLDQVTALQDSIANGQTDAAHANPFAEMILNAFGSPGNFQNSMSELYSPGLGGQLGTAYKNQIGDIAQAGNRSFANDLEGGGANDANFWNYVLANTKRGQKPNEGTNTRRTTAPAPPRSGGGGSVQ